MKNVIAGLIGLVALGATAQTVILYDDGSQYTLKNNEKIYVTTYSKLYQLQQYGQGDFKLNKILPSAGRDHVYVEPSGQGALGSRQWCETYIPWSEGLSFDMIAWQRSCDINGDGEYNMCDYYEPTGISTFEELEWQDKCNDGEPWDGS
jgi:hypothetical protein